jgi:lipopolysaccharide export system ATP-binding protein
MLKLQAVELSKSYRGRKVVDDVELEIGQGEVVGLLGPNGAGKTTTFYILVGLARPDSGHVLLNGGEITDLPMYLRARSGISYLPQEPSVFRQLTSEENLLAVLETLPLTPEQQRDRLEQLLAQMGHRNRTHEQGLHALRRRTPPFGDCALAHFAAFFHSSRRTFFRH